MMLEPFKYAVWDQSGVLTFRGDNFRQNAAYGTVDVQNEGTLMFQFAQAASGATATVVGVGAALMTDPITP